MTSVSPPPTICFVGTSDSGKTTLVTRLIAELKRRGYHVGAVKHQHRPLCIDREGKDSRRMAEAGADATVLTAPTGTVATRKTTGQMPPEEIVAQFLADMDLVLIEGFKHSALPKIEVHRATQREELLCRRPDNHDPHLLAVASDRAWELDVPVFALDAVADLAAFIIKHFNLERPAITTADHLRRGYVVESAGDAAGNRPTWASTAGNDSTTGQETTRDESAADFAGLVDNAPTADDTPDAPAVAATPRNHHHEPAD
jgi:molybdopterin-guanine dinucleotide biosynthesis protein MobB